MYAIIETKGRQFKVAPGDVILAARMALEPGASLTIDRVLVVADDSGNLRVGSPTVEGAKATATVVEHGRHKKIIVFRFKAKSNYRRKTGHRQDYTKLRIDEIVG